MDGLDKIKDKMHAFLDIIMPPVGGGEPYSAEMEDEEKERVKVSAANRVADTGVREEEYQVAGGDSIVYTVKSAPASSSKTVEFPKNHADRPNLTVHTTRTEELRVQIYVPADFDHVTSIADDIRGGKACIVNYERIDGSEQGCICDFINGVCYVMDGCAKRVSDEVVLYVPAGIEVSEAMSAAMTD